MARTPIRHKLEKLGIEHRETANGFLVTGRAIKADAMRELSQIGAEVRIRGENFNVPV